MKSSIILALAEWLCYSFNLYVNKLIAGVDTKGLTKNKEQEKLWQITCQVSCVARKNWNNARVTLEGLQQGSSIYPVRFWSKFSLNPAISMACLASRIPLTLSPAQSRMSLSLYFKILWIPGFAGGCYSFNLYVNKLIAGVDTKGLTKNKEQEKLWQITCQVSCVARKNWNNARVTLEGLQQGSSIYPVRFWSKFSLNPAISMACLASRIPLTLSPAQSRMSLSLYFKILWIPGFGGGRVLG